MIEKIINFDKMITPSIIKILFWIGIAVSIIGGLIMIVQGATAEYGGGGIQVLIGIFTLILGPISTRIYCELLIVMFKINDKLSKIEENTEEN
ncbi:MAG: DUF4282 domain-containing protein [Halanaerobiaceae bacterium]